MLATEASDLLSSPPVHPNLLVLGHRNGSVSTVTLPLESYLDSLEQSDTDSDCGLEEAMDHFLFL